MGRARFWWPNLATTVCRSSEVLPAAVCALMRNYPLTRWGCSAGIRPCSAWPSPRLAPFSSSHLTLSLFFVHSHSPSLAYWLAWTESPWPVLLKRVYCLLFMVKKSSGLCLCRRPVGQRGNGPSRLGPCKTSPVCQSSGRPQPAHLLPAPCQSRFGRKSKIAL